VLDDLSTGRRENLDGVEGVDLVEGDLREAEACRAACDGVEAVFHLAAVPSVPVSIAEPERTFAVNVGGTARLLEAARSAGVRRVVQASSSAVYGDQPTLPKHEGMVPAPRSPYAAHKASVELLAAAYSASLGLEVVSLRYFNVYGPRQDPKAQYAAVVPAFIEAAFAGRAAIIHGDGGQTRDFTYVADVVAANLAAAEAKGAPGRVFNVACGGRTSILELHRAVAEATGTAVAAVHEDTRAGDVRDSFASVDAAREILGWTAAVSLAEGLARTVESMRR
jgi:nucleoside-diphosphate-sugar epimerase